MVTSAYLFAVSDDIKNQSLEKEIGMYILCSTAEQHENDQKNHQ